MPALQSTPSRTCPNTPACSASLAWSVATLVLSEYCTSSNAQASFATEAAVPRGTAVPPSLEANFVSPASSTVHGIQCYHHTRKHSSGRSTLTTMHAVVLPSRSSLAAGSSTALTAGDSACTTLSSTSTT